MKTRINVNTLRGLEFSAIFLLLISVGFFQSCNQGPDRTTSIIKDNLNQDSLADSEPFDEAASVVALLVSPQTPRPGQPFRVLSTGQASIRKAIIEVTSPSGTIKTSGTKTGNGLPYWRIDDFQCETEGDYKVILTIRNKQIETLEFTVTSKPTPFMAPGIVWRTKKSWGGAEEALYSAWTNALFWEADERSSWPALHEVMQNREWNFLYNHLGLNEDDPAAKFSVIMEPDCADNPFYFRAYFAWKLGLPFGYHECDRGYLGKPPQTGNWITNESSTSRPNQVLAFNAFMRRVMDGVHSGTARTAFANESSDYYPLPLSREALRPGTVFADPYGHTLILVKWIPQKGSSPGMLLSVDAQPDGTVAIKRFWKGNFLFATKEVVGEPGFKAFRPIVFENEKRKLLGNSEIGLKDGLPPFSMDQKDLSADVFYKKMDRLINPKPMDPESVLMNLIQALHEQLITRITSIANGESFMKANPGTIIPMPGRAAGVFLAGGSWEDFSTPNRDLRLLIAMDAVLEFPESVEKFPDDFKIPALSSPEQYRKKLESILAERVSQLDITYTRSDGSEQKLTVAEILNRRDAFEMAYNPNDCIEIRWGAPESSTECSTCRRRAPASQQEKMRQVRIWFQKRLHPPT